jgi:hypothetical protein
VAGRDTINATGQAARLRDLGPIECDRLCAAVQRLGKAAWLESDYRQASFNVHRSTQSIMLCFLDLDAWPRLAVSRGAGFERLGAVAQPLMDALIDRAYESGGVVLRAMAVRLPAGARITPHVDEHESLRLSHRVHLPLLTNPRVRFFIDGVPHRLAAGRAVEVNNQLSHSVMNDGRTDRVHFIFDYLPPTQLAAPGLAKHAGEC